MEPTAINDISFPLLGTFFLLTLLLALPFGPPLVLWLRRSPRSASDVLSSVPGVPASLLLRAAQLGFAVVAGVTLLLTQAMVTGSLLHEILTDNCFEAIVIGPDLIWPVGVVLLTGVGLLHWLRRPLGPSSPGDVLRVQVGS